MPTLTRPLIALALLASAAGAHATPAGYYAATPVTAPAKPSLLTRDTPWRLQGATYVADRAPERAEILCQLIAARVGPLSGFSAGGATFNADKLARCNAHVKPVATTAVAAR